MFLNLVSLQQRTAWAYADLDKSGWIALGISFSEWFNDGTIFGRESSAGICGFSFSSFEGLRVVRIHIGRQADYLFSSCCERGRVKI